MNDSKSARGAANLQLNGHATGIPGANKPPAHDPGKPSVGEADKADKPGAEDNSDAPAAEVSDVRTQTADGLPLETRQAHPPRMSLLDTMMAAGNFTTFVSSLKSAGLTERLEGQSAFTIFAPTDHAFEKLDRGFMDRLMQDDPRLKAVLNYHIVAGRIHVRQVRAGNLMTLQGSMLTIATSPRHVRVNGAFLTEMDILATNGVVHAIDALILPAKLQLAAPQTI
jgi:uncharacterized surface protein with fasciclin (FAS1) repeats